MSYFSSRSNGNILFQSFFHDCPAMTSGLVQGLVEMPDFGLSVIGPFALLVRMPIYQNYPL
jgi:hypothetical protein